MKIGGRALKRRAHFLIAAASFAAIYFLHVPFPAHRAAGRARRTRGHALLAARVRRRGEEDDADEKRRSKL